MLILDDETKTVLTQLARYLAGRGTEERALGVRLERLAASGQGGLTVADLNIVWQNLRSQEAIAEAMRDADAEAEVAEAEEQVAFLQRCKEAVQALLDQANAP